MPRELYIPSKEPYILPKEPCIPRQRPNIPSKEPYDSPNKIVMQVVMLNVMQDTPCFCGM